MESEEVRCLVCRKAMQKWVGIEGPVQDGASMWVSFAYGSRYDTAPSLSAEWDEFPPEQARVLKADKIEAFVCDDCFEERTKENGFFIGWRVMKTARRTD